MTEVTYPEVGATERGGLPPGYRHVRVSAEIGTGDATMARATAALLSFELMRRAGLRPEPSAPRAAVGVDVLCRPGIGPLALPVPCRVVWTADESRRAGFGGTGRCPAIRSVAKRRSS
jgi:uncharacterized protein (UPF0548 family)